MWFFSYDSWFIPASPSSLAFLPSAFGFLMNQPNDGPNLWISHKSSAKNAPFEFPMGETMGVEALATQWPPWPPTWLEFGIAGSSLPSVHQTWCAGKFTINSWMEHQSSWISQPFLVAGDKVFTVKKDGKHRNLGPNPGLSPLHARLVAYFLTSIGPFLVAHTVTQ